MRIREPYRACRSQIGDLLGNLATRGVTLHSGRNLIRKVEIGDPSGGSIAAVVKAFRVPARPRGFAYAHLRPSKARRSMAHAEKLLGLGIGTPDPVACIEYVDAGCLRESYYISRYWPSDVDLTSVLYRGGSLGSRTDSLLEHIARFTFLQHENGVQHLDYNPGNLLVRTNGRRFEFALVDLNRLRFNPLRRDERISGLVRLTTSVGYLRIIGREYARLYRVDAEEFRRRLEEAYRRFVARRRSVGRLKSLIRHER